MSETSIHTNKSKASNLFEENSYKAIQKAKNRIKFTILCFISVIAALVLFVVYDQIVTSKNKRIAEEYSKIDVLYNQEVADFQAKNQNNTTPIDNADFTQSMEMFSQFAIQNKETALGWQAAFQSATYYMIKNKLPEAQKVIEAVLPYTENSNIMQIKLKTALATIYAAQKNYSKSTEELSEVENIPNHPLPVQTKFLRGQVLFLSGKKQEAQKVFEEILVEPSNQQIIEKSPARDKILQDTRIWLNYIQ